MSKKKTNEEFKKEIEEKYGNRIEILGNYENNKKKLLVKCNNCGKEYYKTPIHLIKGQLCKYCSNKKLSDERRKTTEQFKKDMIKNNIKDIELLEKYINTKTKIKILNKKCNHTYYSLPGNILKNVGCPICYGYKNTEMFIKILNEKYPNEYEVIGEYINNRTPIKIRHKCGYEWNVIPKDLLKAIRCPKCKMSKGEYYIYNYLKENNIYFEKQYKLKDCKDKYELPFDFMIKVNDKIKLIEFDGTQHYNDTFYTNIKTKEHDKLKNDYCKKNNIELLRIPYWHLRNNKIKEDLDIFINK